MLLCNIYYRNNITPSQSNRTFLYTARPPKICPFEYYTQREQLYLTLLQSYNYINYVTPKFTQQINIIYTTLARVSSLHYTSTCQQLTLHQHVLAAYITLARVSSLHYTSTCQQLTLHQHVLAAYITLARVSSLHYISTCQHLTLHKLLTGKTIACR